MNEAKEIGLLYHPGSLLITYSNIIGRDSNIASIISITTAN